MEKWRRENPGRCLPCGGVGEEYTPGQGFSGTCEACGGTGWEPDVDTAMIPDPLPEESGSTLDGKAQPCP